MCGITGFFQQNSSEVAEPALLSMAHSISHRGPDSEGFYYKKNLGLAQVRLSIIDLSSNANQPFYSKNKDFILVFNGEVYNYLEIRAILEKEGIQFSTQSDTEVVLESYIKWGASCLTRFNGFFAIAVYDVKKDELFIARDRIGVKPLYYYSVNGNFAFASEIKAFFHYPFFTKNISSQALNNYLNFQYIQEPLSIFDNVFKLEAGHYLKLTRKSIEKTEYWSLAEKYNGNNGLSISDNIDLTQELLLSSLKLRLRADVETGLFLSGGNDSSLLLALLSKVSDNRINTFTIGFSEKEFDESKIAGNIALNFQTRHHSQIINSTDCFEVIKELPFIYDEPYADSSAIPTTLLCRFASPHIKVALSGDGGDELFWGYSRYAAIRKISDYFSHFPKIISFLFKVTFTFSNPNKFKRLKYYLNLYQASGNILYLYLWSLSNFKPDSIANLTGIPTDQLYSKINQVITSLNHKVKSPFDLLPLLDIKSYLPDDILVKADRASMHSSIEIREPYLDYRLLEHAINIPLEQKAYNGTKKYILKQILKSSIPEDIINRPKTGFSVPIGNWLQNDLNYLIKDNLNISFIKKQNIFNPKEIDNIVNQFTPSLQHTTSKLWTLIMFQLWYKKWMPDG
jgi:asparagine synthase (glutamine-hydrolysing)